MPHRFIAIEGAIGVGKTTLTRHLSSVIGGRLLLEIFEENPFLTAFYGDRERYAFQSQLFFLLSRYRQQTSQVPHWLTESSVVSDYLFDKNWIFAHLNLRGDELSVYENVHKALEERIPSPDLVIYLRADTEILLQRIAVRDRPYERDMDREYIHALAAAYDAYFTDFKDIPLLVIDTNERDFVRSEADRQWITQVVQSALNDQVFQPTLPDMEASLSPGGVPILAGGRRRLGDFQRFHRALDREKGFISDLFLNYICLTEEVGEIGKDLKRIWIRRNLLAQQLQSESAAHQQAVEENLESLTAELADALAFVLKLANDLGVDLEQSYVSKMQRNWDRTWEW